jgi:hypothetical protein
MVRYRKWWGTVSNVSQCATVFILNICGECQQGWNWTYVMDIIISVAICHKHGVLNYDVWILPAISANLLWVKLMFIYHLLQQCYWIKNTLENYSEKIWIQRCKDIKKKRDSHEDNQDQQGKQWIEKQVAQKQETQCTYNTTLWCLCISTVAMEKQ